MTKEQRRNKARKQEATNAKRRALKAHRDAGLHNGNTYVEGGQRPVLTCTMNMAMEPRYRSSNPQMPVNIGDGSHKEAPHGSEWTEGERKAAKSASKGMYPGSK